MKKIVPTFTEFINEAKSDYIWIAFYNDKSGIEIDSVFSSKPLAEKYKKELNKSKKGEIIGIDVEEKSGYFIVTVLWTEDSNKSEKPIEIFNSEKEAKDFRNNNYKKYKDLDFAEFAVDEMI